MTAGIFGLLRLAGTYQWLPLAPLRALSSLKHLYREAELLSTLGLLSFSRSNQYLMPSPEGYQFLASMEIDCHAPPTPLRAKLPPYDGG